MSNTPGAPFDGPVFGPHEPARDRSPAPQSEPEPLPAEGLYNVHLYATVRVKVFHVRAASYEDAIQRADELADLDRLFPDRTPEDGAPPPGPESVACGGWAEEVTGYLVDVVGDADYSWSRYFAPDPSGVLREDPLMPVPATPVPEDRPSRIRDVLCQARELPPRT